MGTSLRFGECVAVTCSSGTVRGSRQFDRTVGSFKFPRPPVSACATHTPPRIAIGSRYSTVSSFLCLGPFRLRRHTLYSDVSPPLCLAPRRDLTLDIASSPCIAIDFVQTPAYSFLHCSPFLVNVLSWFRYIMFSPCRDLYSFLCFLTRSLSSLAESCAHSPLIARLRTLTLEGHSWITSALDEFKRPCYWPVQCRSFPPRFPFPSFLRAIAFSSLSISALRR